MFQRSPFLVISILWLDTWAAFLNSQFTSKAYQWTSETTVWWLLKWAGPGALGALYSIPTLGHIWHWAMGIALTLTVFKIVMPGLFHILTICKSLLQNIKVPCNGVALSCIEIEVTQSNCYATGVLEWTKWVGLSENLIKWPFQVCQI